jgi:hypothetical protein
MDLQVPMAPLDILMNASSSVVFAMPQSLWSEDETIMRKLADYKV